MTIGYDNASRRTSLTLPNGVTTCYNLDNASRLVGLVYRTATDCISGTVLGNLTYGYDSASNRTSMAGSFARTLLPPVLTEATYNAANRQLTFGAKTLDYDLNGNLTSITDATGLTTLTWDSRNKSGLNPSRTWRSVTGSPV